MDKGGSDKREDLAVREATSTTIARETFADEGLRRQRAERGLIQPFEKVAAAGAVEPHRPRVEIREELGDPGVEGGEGEEGLVPEAGEDPPLRDLHGDFDLRLVPGLRLGRAVGRGGHIRRLEIGPSRRAAEMPSITVANAIPRRPADNPPRSLTSARGRGSSHTATAS